MARRAVKDTEVLGHYVPEGTMVTVGSWASHLLPSIWAAADSFDPTRYEEPRREDKQHRLAHMAFGGGAHKCIGMHFGRAEVKSLVHRILLDLPHRGAGRLRGRLGHDLAADPLRRAAGDPAATDHRSPPREGCMT